jgi:putative ABC transport system permease protein
VRLIESTRLAVQAIRANPLRSMLTVLGNIVAVTAIVTVVSLIQGMNAMVSTAIVGQVGADAFTIQRVPFTRTDEDIERTRTNPLLTLDEASAIRRFSRTVRSVMAQAQDRSTVTYRDRTVDQVMLQGVTSGYLDFSTFDAERGRLPSAVEVERGRPVALIGVDVARRLFTDIDPLDQIIQIGGQHLRVVGISKKKGGFLGVSLDSFVVVPLGIYTRAFGPRPSLSLLVKPRSPAILPLAIDEATTALRVARHLPPSAPNNFGVITSDTVLGLYRQATTGIFLVLVGVVALSLVVGGIVIMNIMLMVVGERTREIGLRKALGARRRDVGWQVIPAAVTPLPASIEPWSAVLGIGITAAVGLVFGLYPAMRAARLDPIEALRRE